MKQQNATVRGQILLVWECVNNTACNKEKKITKL